MALNRFLYPAFPSFCKNDFIYKYINQKRIMHIILYLNGVGLVFEDDIKNEIYTFVTGWNDKSCLGFEKKQET
jgi:hypothetical protein